jgi:hypothetical protein
LGGEHQHRLVAPAGPGAGVGGVDQRVDLGLGQEGDHRPFVAFGWDRQDPFDRGGVLGVRSVSTWHQCAAPPISQSVDTTRYGQGALPLTISASDAAGVPASVTKTAYVDNSTPTISLSGPVDAPSSFGSWRIASGRS